MKLYCTLKNEAKKIEINERTDENGVYYRDINLEFEDTVSPSVCKFALNVPCVDIYSHWAPTAELVRYISPNWSRRRQNARLAYGAPVLSLISKSGKNRLCVSLSDANVATSISFGVSEETGLVEVEISLFTTLTAPMDKYSVTVRLDARDIPYYEALKDTELWWRKALQFGQAYVPENAKLPVDSLWYSFHQQLDSDEIIRECKASKTLGMDTVIIDDGWQTDDNNRGYAFCGDWELCTGKISDMKKLVDEIHKIGMKVLLWFSVPFVGVHSRAYDRFVGMYTNDREKTDVKVLDPRYREVREYLVGIYKRAVSEWSLDGLKLDFIDSIYLREDTPVYDEKRDTVSLEEALEKLLEEVTTELKSINPETMIEFRQGYIGPTIRKYGNMLRVGDCPCDAMRNKVGIVDLRLISGTSAVHSDMIMWHKDETSENVALALLSSMFGVPQISVRLEETSEKHKAVIKSFLDFWKENREVLLSGDLRAQNPEDCYSLVASRLEKTEVVVRYIPVPFEIEKGFKYYLFNASSSNDVVIVSSYSVNEVEYTVTDCCGNIITKGNISGRAAIVNAPMGARIELSTL